MLTPVRHSRLAAIVFFLAAAFRPDTSPNIQMPPNRGLFILVFPRMHPVSLLFYRVRFIILATSIPSVFFRAVPAISVFLGGRSLRAGLLPALL